MDAEPAKRGKGRPPKIETAEEYATLIEEYFESCKPEPMMIDTPTGKEIVKDSKGNPIIIEKHPTTAGLALHLGFSDRQSLYDQDKRGEDFSCVRKKAILRLFDRHEQRLFDANPTGSIFWTKQHGFSDRQEINLSGSVSIIDDIPAGS